MSFTDGAPLEITCRKCGEKIKKDGAWLKNKSKSAICTACGASIVFSEKDPGMAARALRGVDKAVDDLRKAFKNFNK